MTAKVAQVIVTMTADGELTFERWINGARARVGLCPGREILDLRAELLSQRDEIARETEAEKIRERTKAAARHNNVFHGVAAFHGVAFAERTIGAPTRYTAQEKAVKTPAKPKVLSVADLDF